MKNIKKKFVIILVFIALLVIGCTSEDKVMRLTGEQALNHLKNKYGVEFELCNSEYSTSLSHESVYCTTYGLNGIKEQIEVCASMIDGRVKYSDNYFGYLVRTEVENYVSDIVRKEFSEFKLYRDNDYHMFSDKLNMNSTLSDLYAINPKYRANIKVYIHGDSVTLAKEYEEKIKRVVKELVATDRRFSIYLFVVEDTTYNSISRFEQSDFWEYYAKNSIPDGSVYYYAYGARITDGELRSLSTTIDEVLE